MLRQPLLPNIKLSSGKLITHTYAENGSQNADPYMSNTEMMEYNAIRESIAKAVHDMTIDLYTKLNTTI